MSEETSFAGCGPLIVACIIVAAMFGFCDKHIPQYKSPNSIEIDTTAVVKKLQLNKKYLYSFNWDEPDPFQKVQIDTVLILAFKKGYVKYRFLGRYNFDTSTEIYRFRKLIKPLHYKH